MNCTDIDTHLDDFVDGHLNDDQLAEFEQHIASCKSCAERAHAMKNMLVDLQQLPVEEASPDFERRVFAEVRRQHHRQSNRFVAGFATAMAASLAIWFASTVYLPEAPTEQQQVIAVAMNESQTVRLMFEAPADISQVNLSIGLPDNMELNGYPGRRQLSWQTSLKKGQNILALPIMAVDKGQGELVAQLSYGDKIKTIRVVLKTTNDGVMYYQPQAIKSA